MELAAPFDGEWVVGQGASLLNHHYPIPGQSHVLDLIKLDGGRARTGDSQRLESYPAFGAVFARAGRQVVRAVDSNADMAIGQTDAESPVGNHVVIEIYPTRYFLLATCGAGVPWSVKGSSSGRETRSVGAGTQATPRSRTCTCRSRAERTSGPGI